MITLLADAAAATAQGIDPSSVGTIIATVIAALLGGGFLGKKISDGTRIQIDPQPLEISMRKEYVTRTEFAEFKGELKTDVKEMRGLFDQAVRMITDRDERLTSDIKGMAERMHTSIQEVQVEAAERRRRIHDKLNEHADQLARIDARTEVSKSIGKAAAAIMALANKQSS